MRLHPFVASALLLLTGATLSAADSGDPIAQHRDAFIRIKSDAPFVPEPIRPPLRKNRGPWSRPYSYSVMNYALRAFWTGRFNAEANRVLVENCRFYLENPLVRQEHDSFYWSTDLLGRIVEFFGRNGTRNRGRLAPETEAVIEEMLWHYCRDASKVADADWRRNSTWNIILSDNHQMQQVMTLWHGFRILSRSEEYRDRVLGDGRTLREHHAAWTDYTKELLRERVRKGLFVEFASKGYGAATLKCLYNFHDFAADPELRHAARAVLDLYWATRAEETIDGVRGGAAARVYHGPAALSAKNDRAGRIFGFYFGEGFAEEPSENDLSIVTSEYRVPRLILDLARDVKGRGTYEIRQRVMGAAAAGASPQGPIYRVDDTRDNTLLRYSFCTPEFIIGTAMFPPGPWQDWAMINSQNRWQGVVFRGHPDARIVPECEPLQVSPNISARTPPPNRSVHSWWSLQHRGTLITQRNPGGRDNGGMRVWFSAAGLSRPTMAHGWAVTESAGAFAAVRVVTGGHKWEPPRKERPALPRGQWLRCVNPDSPVIVEVALRGDYRDRNAFVAALKAREPEYRDGTLTYRSLGGAAMAFSADPARPSTVTGRPVDLNPPRVFDSPFIQSEWNSGRVTVRHGGDTHVIDVNAPAAPARGDR